ncbi:MAG: PIN domain-containing protein [Solirubrobacteraceae bacterium]
MWRSGRLPVDTIDQAVLVAEILYRAADAATAVRDISRLSEQFAREDERLEFLVLASALGRGDTLPDDLAARVRDGFESFPEKFPESLLLRAEKAPTTPAELDEFARRYAPEAAIAEEMHAKVLAGDVPVAALAAAAGKDLGTVWSALQWLPLGYGDKQLDELERGDAADAIGRPAVWDPASLFVAGGLGNPVRDLLLSTLPGSVIANCSFDDADRAATAVGGDRPAGTVGYDTAADRAVVTSIAEDAAERDRLRREGMLALAKSLTKRPDHVPEAAGDPWNDAVAQDKLRGELSTWAATMAVARREDLPIYSDDRHVRLSARSDGLRAFGTVALLDALADRGLLDEDTRARARRRLLASGAEGVRPTVGELVEIAEDADWEPVPALAAAIRDASAWRNDRLAAWHRATDFLAAVHERRPQHLDAWAARLLAAVDAGAPDIDAAQRVHSLLVGAWDVLEHPPKTSDAFFQALVRALQELPFWLRPWPSVDIPLLTMQSTLQIAAQYGPEVQTVVFLRMWRRLAGPDHVRAAERFIGRP